MGTVLTAVAAALLKDDKSTSLFLAGLFFALSVGASAAAYWSFGWGVTDAANKHNSQPNITLKEVAEEKRAKMTWANIFGFAEIILLALGLLALAIGFHPLKPPSS
jgi:hypothetical protein